MNAPERVWVEFRNPFVDFARWNDATGGEPYIRADLYDAQAAEIADLRRQLAGGSFYKETDIDNMQNEIADLRRQLAEADLAVAEALRKAEAVMRAHMVSAERCVALEDRAEAAEAEVARLKEAVIAYLADDKLDTGILEAALTPKGDTP